MVKKQIWEKGCEISWKHSPRFSHKMPETDNFAFEEIAVTNNTHDSFPDSVRSERGLI